MVNYKTAKWCLGVALSVSLSACNMWNPEPVRPVEPMNKHYEAVKPQSPAQAKSAAVSKPKAVQKTYATKDPSQKATPGPVRKAAPQLPVIE